MKRILIIFFVAILTSCSSNPHWKEFAAKGLPNKDDHYNDLIFINDSIGYLGGWRTKLLKQTGDNYQFTDSTILFKTLDRGKHWYKIPLNYQGSIDKIIIFNDTLIGL